MNYVSCVLAKLLCVCECVNGRVCVRVLGHVRVGECALVHCGCICVHSCLYAVFRVGLSAYIHKCVFMFMLVFLNVCINTYEVTKV